MNGLPEKMCEAQCVALEKGILIAGSSGNKNSYILKKGKWERFIGLPFSPYVPSVVLSGNVFAFNNEEIFSLKIGENKWEELSIKSKTEYGGAQQIVEENGFIFITYAKRWDVFDVAKKEWVFAGDSILPFEMKFHGFLFLKTLSNPPIYRFLIWGGIYAGNKAWILSYDMSKHKIKPTFEVCEASKPRDALKSAYFRKFFLLFFFTLFFIFFPKKRGRWIRFRRGGKGLCKGRNPFENRKV